MTLRLTLRGARAVLNAVALLAISTGAQAAGQAKSSTPANEQLPKALQGVARATGECRVDPGQTAAANAAQATPDLSCGATVSAIKALQRGADTVMIDVRDADAYAAFHIDGTLQANLADVRSKPHWRGKTVVLVGSGKAEVELYRACASMKKSFKQVLVLRGGVPAWLAAGEPVLGRPPAAASLARLSVADFWLESQHGENLIVLDKQQAALQSDIPFSMVLPEVNATAIKNLIAQRGRALKGGGPAAVVLATGAPLSDPQLTALQQALAPVPLLVNADTRTAFRAQQRTQLAVVAAQARGPKQLGCGL